MPQAMILESTNPKKIRTVLQGEGTEGQRPQGEKESGYVQGRKKAMWGWSKVTDEVMAVTKTIPLSCLTKSVLF